MSDLRRVFENLKKQGNSALIGYVTGGDPEPHCTPIIAEALIKGGVDILELGIPFSDPLADGPIIQEASQAALKGKTNLHTILKLVRAIRRHADVPICLMTYYNPVFCFGEERFVREARMSGVDGVIIPDLPPEEARAFIKMANKANLDIIFFLAPTSTIKRVKFISRIAKGFIYYVALTGVTGLRGSLSADIMNNIRTIKKNTKKPVCVGFGISQPYHVQQVCKIADGAIVGSAIVKKIRENIGNPGLVRKVSRFVCSLKGEKNSVQKSRIR